MLSQDKSICQCRNTHKEEYYVGNIEAGSQNRTTAHSAECEQHDKLRCKKCQHQI